MDKRIASEFAFGVIVFLAVVVGGVYFLQGQQKDFSETGRVPSSVMRVGPSPAPQQTGSCAAHYYEGNQEVHVWPAAQSTNSGKDGLVVNIAGADAKMLPAKKIEGDSENSGFTVKLIDADSDIQDKVQGATEEKPAVITIKGYAQVCTEPPLVSIRPATVAFKKS